MNESKQWLAAALSHGLPLRRARKLVSALLGLRGAAEKAASEGLTEAETEKAWIIFCALAEAVLDVPEEASIV